MPPGISLCFSAAIFVILGCPDAKDVPPFEPLLCVSAILHMYRETNECSRHRGTAAGVRSVLDIRHEYFSGVRLVTSCIVTLVGVVLKEKIARFASEQRFDGQTASLGSVWSAEAHEGLSRRYLNSHCYPKIVGLY